MMKKKLGVLFFGLFCASLLAACTGGPEANPEDFASSDDNTITVWVWDTNFNIPIAEKAAEYYKQDGNENVTSHLIIRVKRG